MPVCTNIRRKKRQPCIGDMDSLVTLQNRTLVPEISGAGASEDFVDASTDVWALVETTAGETIFDGVNKDVSVTHKFTICYDPSVTAETWVLFDGNRFDIMNVEDLDGRHQYLVLRTTDRGLASKKATHA